MYEMTDKRIRVDQGKKDFEKRIFILMKRNQGWTFQRIGDHFKTTKQAVEKIYKKIKGQTIEELENEYWSYQNGF